VYICTIQQQTKQNTMTTFTNITGSKKVNILLDATKVFRAYYIQVYNGQEQVLESNCYSSYIMAEKWANKKLK
jgi:hypothetical protein